MVATVTRTGDTDITQLSDPADLPSRVVSFAEALRGQYDSILTYSEGVGRQREDHMEVKTNCLRTGERCMSFFLDPAPGGITQPFVFANGTFTRISEWDDPCGGRQSHVKLTGTMKLPQPPQDPVNVISGHGNAVATGGGCVDATYDQVMNRTGD